MTQGTAGTEWDVVVVGGGIIGCAIARELARRRAKVILFEARAVGAGATQASAGVLAPYIEAPSDGPLHSLTVQSLSLYDEFVSSARRESNVAIEYRRCGTLEVAHDVKAAEQLNALGEWVRSKGVEARWIDSSEVGRMEPALAPTCGGLVVPSHGYVHAAQLTNALAVAARGQGAEVCAGRHVDGMTADGDWAMVNAGGEVYRARTVVIAAGSWSSEIAPETSVAPVRGQLVRVRWEGAPIQRILWSEGCYIVPWLDGTLLVGATVEQVGFDERVTAGGVRTLLDAASAVLPAIANATFLEARVGLRPFTATGLPVVRRSAEHRAVVYATGHYRNGILLAPLTASLVADMIR
ncbi:MAG: glycine oxidase ThiO [Vicinamibacterales bacterium]